MRCLIVDDSADFRDAATDMLERAGIDVVGVACSGAEALRRYSELRPDVTLVDVELAGESGFDVVERLYGADVPAPAVILISTHSEQDYAEMIAASSALGFLAKFALSPTAIRSLLAARVQPTD